MEKRYCPTCGEEIKLTDKFCPFCGIALIFTYRERQAFVKFMRDAPKSQPKHKKLIKRFKKLIHRKNDKNIQQ